MPAAAVRSPARLVPPLPGAAPYQGGKRNLAKRLIERIEAIPHRCYAEPFVGTGGVFFRRRGAPAAEVINDRSRDVATFFRVLQRHYVPLVDMMRWQLTTRAEFERLRASDPDTLTDLERAARFYYLQRTAFGGKIVGRSFGVVTDTGARFDISKLVPELEALHARLAGVVIECLPFDAFLARYDRPHTLFYLDPPYYGCEGDYGPLFGREDFVRLAEVLAALEGRFLLSLDDHPAVREIFGAFAIESLSTTYTVGKAKAVGEVLISNAPPIV
jgi:DNA adenine methylase